MAKWNNEKLEEDVSSAEQKNEAPVVPVSTPRKLNREETLRRYERG